MKIGYRREVNRQSPFSPQEIWIVRKTGTDSEKARRGRERERRENRVQTRGESSVPIFTSRDLDRAKNRDRLRKSEKRREEERGREMR